ncbi:MAG: hypothetical protein Q8Q42_04040 [Nanoarchaeota archaeon]|nr:hypothetical protein [Nanoarchaeota archaeon]
MEGKKLIGLTFAVLFVAFISSYLGSGATGAATTNDCSFISINPDDIDEDYRYFFDLITGNIQNGVTYRGEVYHNYINNNNNKCSVFYCNDHDKKRKKNVPASECKNAPVVGRGIITLYPANRSGCVESEEYATMGNERSENSCVDEIVLNKNVCVNRNEMDVEKVVCTGGCLDTDDGAKCNAAIAFTNSTQCMDTDGGVNPNVPGEIFVNGNSVIKDTCYSGNNGTIEKKLVELSCGNSVVEGSIEKCQYGWTCAEDDTGARCYDAGVDSPSDINCRVAESSGRNKRVVATCDPGYTLTGTGYDSKGNEVPNAVEPDMEKNRVVCKYDDDNKYHGCSAICCKTVPK